MKRTILRTARGMERGRHAGIRAKLVPGGLTDAPEPMLPPGMNGGAAPRQTVQEADQHFALLRRGFSLEREQTAAARSAVSNGGPRGSHKR
jgi:hypothetical protein